MPERSRRFVDIESVARRKLQMIDAAVHLKDLKIPPEKCLEALQGDWKGRYSIRINDQWASALRGGTETHMKSK